VENESIAMLIHGLRSSMAAGAPPEAADVTLTLSLLPPGAREFPASVIATAVLNLHDHMDDVDNLALPAYAAPTLEPLLARYAADIAAASAVDGGDPALTTPDAMSGSLRHHGGVADVLLAVSGVALLHATVTGAAPPRSRR